MRGRDKSMAQRLVVWLTATLTCFWLAATGLGAYVMQEEFGEIFDSALEETAARLLPLVVDDLFQRSDDQGPLNFQQAAPLSEEEYVTYQVRDASGKVLMHSHDQAREPFNAPLKSGFWDGDGHRVYTLAAISNTIFIQVADPLGHRREALREGAAALLLPLFLLVPGSVLLVWLIVRRVMAPVEDLRAAIGVKDSGNLADMSVDALPRELQPIVLSVNALLARLRTALDAEREFTANSAHELRTPLAGALAQTEVLIALLGDGPARDRARQVEHALTRLAGLTEKLLQLSRAEAGIGAADRAIDLLPVIDLVVTDFRRRMDDPGRLEVLRAPDARLFEPADPDAFAIVLRNLVENAIRHGASDEPITLRIEEGATMSIANGGPVLATEELAAIRRRFGRGRTQAPGSGLGLSIVERLLQQMNAELVLSSPASGRDSGFEARIRFLHRAAAVMAGG
ncbi:two-component system, OmpR family, sensor kinase [Rhizobium sp. RU20A]|uniref:sensor histidine kinase n=1 Tax=Rhizobium sp. RU20A TaxID=1907412 RepID=UPI000955CCBB|nr:ATP-binding protein [Rhizobium sp. RU20A]SIQ76582.1 two-component system, OmpR family, sensor kinase [Rhizobium sp. RU20A]